MRQTTPDPAARRTTGLRAQGDTREEIGPRWIYSDCNVTAGDSRTRDDTLLTFDDRTRQDLAQTSSGVEPGDVCSFGFTVGRVLPEEQRSGLSAS